LAIPPSLFLQTLLARFCLSAPSFLPQGVGLRPRPWAGFCRPFRPAPGGRRPTPRRGDPERRSGRFLRGCGGFRTGKSRSAAPPGKSQAWRKLRSEESRGRRVRSFLQRPESRWTVPNSFGASGIFLDGRKKFRTAPSFLGPSQEFLDGPESFGAVLRFLDPI